MLSRLGAKRESEAGCGGAPVMDETARRGQALLRTLPILMLPFIAAALMALVLHFIVGDTFTPPQTSSRCQSAHPHSRHWHLFHRDYCARPPRSSQSFQHHPHWRLDAHYHSDGIAWRRHLHLARALGRPYLRRGFAAGLSCQYHARRFGNGVCPRRQSGQCAASRPIPPNFAFNSPTMDVRGTRSTGTRIGTLMREQDDVNLELVSENVIVAVFGIGEDVTRSASRLVDGLRHAVETLGSEEEPDRAPHSPAALGCARDAPEAGVPRGAGGRPLRRRCRADRSRVARRGHPPGSRTSCRESGLPGRRWTTSTRSSSTGAGCAARSTAR